MLAQFLGKLIINNIMELKQQPITQNPVLRHSLFGLMHPAPGCPPQANTIIRAFETHFMVLLPIQLGMSIERVSMSGRACAYVVLTR